MAFSKEGLWANNEPSDTEILLAVETIPPYEVHCFILSSERIMIAKEKMVNALGEMVFKPKTRFEASWTLV